MTHIISKAKIFTTMALAVIFAVSSSFSYGKGGEGFEIYLNNKLVLQQFGSQMNTIKSIQLDQRFSNDQLVIKYHHCGQAGKNRIVVIKDAQNKILKEWKFPNVSTASLSLADVSMTCKIKDILNLQKSHPGKLSLYYSSNELPKGRILATIISEESEKVEQ